MEQERLVELIDQAAQGHSLAAESLFHEFQPRVWRLALRYTRGRQEDAKDILQETFMKAFAKLTTLRDRQRFGPWLMQITSNIALQRIRGNEREGRFLERWSAEQRLPGGAKDPLLRELKIKIVRDLLADLPDEGPARVVKLHYGDPPLKTAEIAAHLDMPRGTVTVTLQRFRDRIRERLVMRLAALDDLLEVRP